MAALYLLFCNLVTWLPWARWPHKGTKGKEVIQTTGIKYAGQQPGAQAADN